jgi:hypothetical protein
MIFQNFANMYAHLAVLGALLAAEELAAGSVIRRADSSSVWNMTTCAASELDIIKEWSDMNSSEKAAYIAAEQCLWNSPAKTTFIGTVNRHDDLTAVRQYLTPIIHAVVSFFALMDERNADENGKTRMPGSISAVAQALYEDS